MKRLNLILLFMFCLTAVVASDYVPEPYTWTTQSKNSSESMPCGGHDVGMNVWVENGEVLFYACRSGWFDENNTLLKAGRFRLKFSEPLSDEGFSQTLNLDEGCIYIKDKTHAVRIWADVNQPVIYAEILKGNRNDVVFSYESWRYKDRPLTKAECQQSSWKWNIPTNCKTYTDSIMPLTSSLTFWHQNRAETVFDYTVNKEGLDSVKHKIYNPIGGLRYGGTIIAKGFTFDGTTDGVYAGTDYRAWNYKARALSKGGVVIALSLPEGGANPMLSSKAGSVPMASASFKASKAWWHAFWQRSWIITTEPKAKEMVRNYELFRYMLGCNAYGEWPSKFNGGLFTFDPVHEDAKAPFTPDYRRWGGGTMTAQNQRLVYWPMLKSGDFDMMPSQFDTYLRMLPTAQLRTKCYWGHDGASFCEQIENFGLPNPAEYGKHKPGEDMGNERNAWLEYQWDTALEFCQMILLADRYIRGEQEAIEAAGGHEARPYNFDIKKYEPLIEQCLIFFDQHYRYLAKQRGVKDTDADGKLILYPSSGCETYKMAYNPSSVIAALKTVSMGYYNYKVSKDSKDSKNLNDLKDPKDLNDLNDSIWLKLYSSIPDIPVKDGMIAPAVVWARIQNVETPQLYPVFPWRMADIQDIAVKTYFEDSHAKEMRSTKGWKQDNIWAACLGLTDEAVRLNTEKFASGPYRFPAFWDAGFDWSPDLNRGGAAMIGLQEMLLQETPDGEAILLPAWPKEWNVKFKLHCSKGVVEFQ